jgi:hypothetical protein
VPEKRKFICIKEVPDMFADAGYIPYRERKAWVGLLLPVMTAKETEKLNSFFLHTVSKDSYVVNIEKGIAALRKTRGKKKSARFWNGLRAFIPALTFDKAHVEPIG